MPEQAPLFPPLERPNLTGDSAEDRSQLGALRDQAIGRLHLLIRCASSFREGAVYYACLGTPAAVGAGLEAMRRYKDMHRCALYARRQIQNLKASIAELAQRSSSSRVEREVDEIVDSFLSIGAFAEYTVRAYRSLRADGGAEDPPPGSRPALGDGRDSSDDDEWNYRNIAEELQAFVSESLAGRALNFGAVLPDSLPLRRL